METDVYTLLIFHETEKAVKVGSSLEERHAGVWLPKSKIDIRESPKHELEGGFEVKDIEVPDWLAENAGLV